MNTEIVEILLKLKKEFNKINDLDEKVQALNLIRENLAYISPFSEPIECVKWIKASDVIANDYNPNFVANPEMKLLHESIKLDGYTQPIVASKNKDGKYTVIDGEHRKTVGSEYKDINDRVHNYLPVVILKKSLQERISSTIRHNRARGVHKTQQMSNIVVELLKLGWEDYEICKQLGMDADELLRLKQIIGVDEIYSNEEYGRAWELYDDKNISENNE